MNNTEATEALKRILDRNKELEDELVATRKELDHYREYTECVKTTLRSIYNKYLYPMKSMYEHACNGVFSVHDFAVNLDGKKHDDSEYLDPKHFLASIKEAEPPKKSFTEMAAALERNIDKMRSQDHAYYTPEED